ncbi:hypothetical protein [Rossellomorea marisflavi]|jgi:uncharacterized membrane protein|uniref:hypothetical protein n=1 Tax=Rossellomorea marisflavi TaxID=189381 RepID=UPI00190F5134|nr:hypothetical protein [Rossellomorea marisflavi]
MNQTLSTFLKIGVTVVAIGAFLFGVAYTLVGGESDHYSGRVTAVESKLAK